MSTWSNLANNRFLSTNNILQGVISGSISLFTGNTLTFSNTPNQWVDKLSFSNSVPHGTLSNTFNTKLDNQWITKNDIIPAMECPFDYSATFSNVINNYNCYNLTNAMGPLYTKTAQRVSSTSWNNKTWIGGTSTLPRLYSTYDTRGTGIYATFGIRSNGGINSVWINNSLLNEGRMNATAVWIKDNFVTITSDTYVNGYYTNSTPVSYDTANSIWVPVEKWFGFAYTYTASVSKQYYIGINGDNLVKVSCNGVTILDTSNNYGMDYTGAFTQWCIYPLYLNSGVYNFNFSVENLRVAGSILGNPGGFSAELYDFTGLTDSTYPALSDALTYYIASTASLDPYIKFSTKDMADINFSIGEDFAYSCPIYGGTLLSPDQNGIYSCLTTYPQTNYDINTGPNYLTFVVGITQSNKQVSFQIDFDRNLGSLFTEQLITINFGDKIDTTDLIDTANTSFTYSSANIPPYTGNTIFTYSFSDKNLPIGLSPSLYQNSSLGYNLFYTGNVGSITYGSSVRRNNVIISYTYSSIGTYNVQLYPSINTASASGVLYIKSNNGVIRFITQTNNFKNYYSLNLDNNQLLDINQNINDNVFNNLKVVGEPDIPDGSRITSFSNNKLTNFDPTKPIFFFESFTYNSQISYNKSKLDLSYNFLTQYDPKLIHNYNNLLLNNNLLTYFNPINNPLYRIYNPIQATLNLSFNKITSVTAMSYSLPNYGTIRLNNNPLTTFNPYTYINGVSQSVFTQSGATGGNYYFYLNSCSMSYFDPDYPLANNLQLLDLNNNQITSFNPSSVLLSSTNLQYLYLNSNRISSFTGSNIPNSLIYLQLQFNSLGTASTYFSCDILPKNLLYLNLSDNPLIGISASSFANVNGLQTLIINNCPNYKNMTPDFNLIKFTASNSSLSIQSGNGFTVSSSVSFDNNLTSITINNSYGNSALYYFNPSSLPTKLTTFNLASSGSNYPLYLNSFNFDVFFNTQINTINMYGVRITTASASSVLPNTLKSIRINGGQGTSYNILIPLSYVDDNLLPSSVNFVNFSYCSLTSSALQSILTKLDTNGATSGTLYINNQYAASTTIVTSGMSASLHSLMSKGWNCYATGNVGNVPPSPYAPILFT